MLVIGEIDISCLLKRLIDQGRESTRRFCENAFFRRVPAPHAPLRLVKGRGDGNRPPGRPMRGLCLVSFGPPSCIIEMTLPMNNEDVSADLAPGEGRTLDPSDWPGFRTHRGQRRTSQLWFDGTQHEPR